MAWDPEREFAEIRQLADAFFRKAPAALPDARDREQLARLRESFQDFLREAEGLNAEVGATQAEVERMRQELTQADQPEAAPPPRPGLPDADPSLARQWRDEVLRRYMPPEPEPGAEAEPALDEDESLWRLGTEHLEKGPSPGVAPLKRHKRRPLPRPRPDQPQPEPRPHEKSDVWDDLSQMEDS